VRDYPALTVLPADSGSGIAVSATGPIGFAIGTASFDRPADHSNYGHGIVWVSAPGGDFVLPEDAVCTVLSVTHFCWVFDMVLSTSRGSRSPPTFSFAWAAGTSMAAPMVAGVAALIKGANPDIPLGQLKARLAQSAERQRNRAFHGHGFINAYRACAQ
jgi:lantibiotic leader peptide-processing serine protease